MGNTQPSHYTHEEFTHLFSHSVKKTLKVKHLSRYICCKKNLWYYKVPYGDNNWVSGLLCRCTQVLEDLLSDSDVEYYMQGVTVVIVILFDIFFRISL